MCRVCIYFLILLIFPSFTGCVVVDLHTTRQAEVRVTYRDTDKPVSGAQIEVGYSYIGYGVFYILRLPKPVSARTDENGLATLPLASCTQHMNFQVNGNPFAIDQRIYYKGGFPWCIATYNPPPLDVRVTPLK